MKIPQLLQSQTKRIFTFGSSLVLGAVALVSHPLGMSLITLFGTSLGAPTFAQVSQETAPKGSYTAVLDSSTVSNRLIGRGGTRRRTGSTDAGAGSNIQITLISFSTKTELDAVAQAEQSNLATTIRGFNHGSVTLDGESYPINYATSFRNGDNYRINLASSNTFTETDAQGGVANAAAVGYITLIVPVSEEQGTGSFYTATAVTVTPEGDVQPVGGRTGATATQLTAVSRVGS